MPSPVIYNRGQIIEQGLELGGAGPEIEEKAQIFLNTFLDHLSRRFDWPELVRSYDFATVPGSEFVDISEVSVATLQDDVIFNIDEAFEQDKLHDGKVTLAAGTLVADTFNLVIIAKSKTQDKNIRYPVSNPVISSGTGSFDVRVPSDDKFLYDVYFQAQAFFDPTPLLHTANVAAGATINITTVNSVGAPVPGPVPAYRAIKWAVLRNNFGRLIQVPYHQLWEWVEQDRNTTISRANPTHFAVRPDGLALVVWPVPSTVIIGSMLYYEQPLPIVLGNDGNGECPWFRDVHALIEAVGEFAKYHDEEELFQIADRRANIAVSRATKGIMDTGRAAPAVLRRDPNRFFRIRND